ncbi:MAG: cell wall-binding repeat-containing protein [Parcubacteria group bacterium]
MRVLFSVAIGTSLLRLVPGQAPKAHAAGSLSRVAGANRIETAIKVSEQLFPANDSAGGVILARQDTFPDALTANSLTGLFDAPILLTSPGTSLNANVRAEIDRVLASGSTVVIIGGPAAISSTVDEELSGTYVVERLAGADRYETAQLIKERGDKLRGGTTPTTLIARGDTYPDALSGSSYAAFAGVPILLVRHDEIPLVEQSSFNPSMQSPFILGGTAAVGDAVLSSIESSTGSIAIRIGGADRYETAQKIADYFFPTPLAISLATGRNFPDALAGGVLAGLSILSPVGMPMLLVEKNVVPPSIENYLTGHAATIDDATSGYLFGGTAALSIETELAAEALL